MRRFTESVRTQLASLILAGAAAQFAFGQESLDPSDPGVGEAGLSVMGRPTASESLVNGVVAGIATASDGYLFIGSSRLAVFDGATWDKIDIPSSGRNMRLAASADGNRIWVGAVGAWGWVERRSPGHWVFVPLPTPIDETQQIRCVFAESEGAVFVSHSAVMRWDGRRLERWDLPSPFALSASSIDGIVYVYQSRVGLLRMDKTGPALVIPQANLPSSSRLISWLSTPDGRGNLAIFDDSAYRWENGVWTELTELTNAIRGKLAVCAIWMDSRTLAVGTYRAGTFLVTPSGTLISRVDAESGLSDNNVYQLWASHGELWIGTGTGYAHISDFWAASCYDERVGLGPATVRKVDYSQGHPYILTAHRIYCITPSADHGPGKLSRVDHYWPSLYDAIPVGNQYWAAGEDGISAIEGVRIAARKFTDHAVVRICAPGGFNHRIVLFLRGGGLEVYSPDTGELAESDIKLSGNASSVLEALDGRIWVLGDDGSVNVLGCDSGSGRLSLLSTINKGRGSNQVGSTGGLCRLGGDIFLWGVSGAYRFDPTAKAFLTVPELAGMEVRAADSPAPSQTECYWIVRFRSLGDDAPSTLVRVRDENGHISWEPISAPGLGGAGDNSDLSLTAEGKSVVVWVGGSNGLLRYDPARLSTAPLPPAIALAPIAASAPNQKILFVPAEAVFSADGAYFQSRLLPLERDWRQAEIARSREFTGLAAGSYVLQARSVDQFGRFGPASSYKFAVPSPWYLSATALIAWAAGLGSLVFVAIRWRVHGLERQAERLNRLVNERTRELSLSNTAKSEFLENISHEIRNPLAGIDGLVQMLEASGLPEQATEHAKALKACTDDLKRTFEDVLGFSRLEYGQIPLVERELRVQALIDSVRDMFSVDAALAGVTVSTHYPSDWKDGFVGDASKIRTIIANYVGNALKYAPGSPIDIQVSQSALESGDHERVQVVIEVVDHGPGVPHDEQELIFKKFVRGSRAKADQTPGTGIGLATCRLTAELLGGSVGIHSPETGTGSTFFLRLPLRRCHSAAGESRSAQNNAPTALVVEDQGYQRQLLLDLLSSVGYAADGVQNSSAALEALAARSYAIVITDLDLPGIGGAELARRMRQLPLSPPPFIIGSSAETTIEAENTCLDSGMDAFMPKPHTRAALNALLAAKSCAIGTIDMEALELYARHTPGGLAKASAVYLKVLAEELAELQAACAARSAGDIAAASHRVRAHAAIVGGGALLEAAAELERYCRRGQLEDVERLMRAVGASASALRYRFRIQLLIPSFSAG